MNTIACTLPMCPFCIYPPPELTELLKMGLAKIESSLPNIIFVRGKLAVKLWGVCVVDGFAFYWKKMSIHA